jgi:ABC-2 type transport system ATP-binding protein
MTARAPAIQTHGLRKAFGQRVAVADLSLTVERGEIFGFLGPNGAGKTTAVKMLLGLVEPTAGHGRLFGRRLGDHRVRARVGFLPEHFRFHDWLTAPEFLTLHADLYGLQRRAARSRVPELIDLVGLSDNQGKRLRQFSKGMLQRIGLAQTLLADPELVILDEPNSGLDPVGCLLVRRIMRDLSRRGTTVFLNSHLLSEVEITCDRVAFVNRGEVVRTGTLEELTDGELAVEGRMRNLSPSVVSGLAGFGRDVRIDGERLSMTVTSEAQIPEVHRYLVEQRVELFSFTSKRLSLEELFLQIVGTGDMEDGTGTRGEGEG